MRVWRGAKKERFVQICFWFSIMFDSITNAELPNIFDLQKKWPTVSSMWSTINLKAFFAQVKNIQREKHGGGAGKDGGEVRIQQVWTIHANFPILGSLAHILVTLSITTFVHDSVQGQMWLLVKGSLFPKIAPKAIWAGCSCIQPSEEEPQDRPADRTQVGHCHFVCSH